MAFAAEKPRFGKGMFTVDPNSTPEQLATRRALLAMIQPKYGSAKYVGEGLGQLATGVVSGLQNKRMRDVEGENTGRASSIFAGLLGGAGASEIAGHQPMSILGTNPSYGDPNDHEQIASDAMSALGKGPGGVDFSEIEKQYGLPSGYLSQTAQIESGMNSNAKNPNSSAEGLFQFIDATASDYGLTDKRDPNASTDAAARLAKDNAAQLRNVLGREPTAGELYLAHQQGGAGASRLLSNPDALASAIVGADAVRLNGGSENMTAGEFANKWTSRLSGQMPQSANPAMPQIPPDQLFAALSNPWLSQEQRGMLQQILDQQVSAGDPMKALEFERANLELEQLRNPQVPPGFQPMSAQEVAALGLPPGVYQRGPDGRIDTVEKTQATVDPIADLKARAMAAGLTEGTPEYQAYMLTGEMIQPNGGSEYGLNPVYGTDADGNPVVMQLGKDGTAVATALPEGVTPDLALAARERARGSAEGKGGGEAALTLPGAQDMMTQINEQIEGLIKDPYLDRMLGPIDSILPNTSEDAARLQGKFDQLAGGAFLQARQMLKGSGAITDFESLRAEAAYARLNKAQSPEDYALALKEFQSAVADGVRALEAQIAVGGGNQGAPSVPEFDDDAAYLKSLGLE